MLLRTASDIGDILRDARRQRGWTQQEVADAAGVSRPWISMVENGKTSVEFHLVIGTLHALGYSASVQRADAPERSNGPTRTPLTRQGKPLRSRRLSRRGTRP